MRMTARATGHLRPVIALIALVALVACLAGTGCGKKEQAASAPSGMPAGAGGGGMSGSMPGGMGGGMPGMSGGMGGGMPGMSGPGGAPGAAPGGAPGGTSAPAPSSAPSGGAPAASPAVTAASPAAAPSAAQLALVDEALWTLRVMMRPNVLPPHPSEVKPRPTTVKTPTGAAGGGAAPGGMGMSPGGMGGGAPGGMAPGGMAPGGMAPGGTKTSQNPFGARDYRFAQGGPPAGKMPGGPGGMAPGGPGGAPKAGGPAAGGPASSGAGPAAGGAAAPKAMNSMAIAQAIKVVAQKTRGLDLNDQKFYHEYWFLLAKGLLDEVGTKYSDFPVAELSWAAQTRPDWEGYLWHWGARKMLEQTSYSSLQDTAKMVAKARTGLAAVRAICKYGLLMNDVDRTKFGNVVQPTLKHTINCVQLAFGNPNYDPATIKRDETRRSRLVVEVFDNYLKWGHNWRWDRSRNWAYLARYSEGVGTIRCDSCGAMTTVQHQTWRCKRCGKALRPAVPGTWDAVRPYSVQGYTDDYRVAGMRNPATDTGPGGKYQLGSDWNTPTYQRMREGYRNAQRVHEMVAMVSASNLPTKADKAVMGAWVKASPKPDRIPEIHRMELEAHDMRLNNAVSGQRTSPTFRSKPVYPLSPSTVEDQKDKARRAAVGRVRNDRAGWSPR